LGAYLVLSTWKPGNWLPAGLSLLQLLIWSYLLLLFFGFGKIDHTYASMMAALLVLPVWLGLWAANRMGSGGFKAFQAAIWGCYFFSGLEKVFLSGWNWVRPEHFETLARLHPNGWATNLTQWPMLGSLVLALGLCFQLSAIVLLWYPRWAIPMVCAGIFFHLGTWILLDVGGWQSPWIPMLLFLWPFTEEKKESDFNLRTPRST
jgi:hypothetical protein